MNRILNKWFNNLKSFDWKMFLALCLLALVPAIYQTLITKLINNTSNGAVLDIIGQMEWFDLIDETLCAFLIVPMYSILSKAFKTDKFNKIVFKLGAIVLGLYILFNIGVFVYGTRLISFMNPNEVDVFAAYYYLMLETIAFIIGFVFSYASVVFLVIDKAKHMYVFMISKMVLALIADLILIPNMGINGVAISNIISNIIICAIAILMLIKNNYIKVAKFENNDKVYLKDLAKVGLFAGGQQFLDNIIYALMIVRMVNAVSESGNYWVSNNFIWGWLLIPITCLAEIIRKDAGANGYKLKQINYYSIVTIVLFAWAILIPTYKWFLRDVEGLTNYERIYEIIIKNLGFYIAYALSQIPDSIFVGMGKTEYNAINSLICNIAYYGLWFILYKTGAVLMNMDMIIVMFGCGNIVHLAVSLVEERVFLKRELLKNKKVGEF